MTRCLTCTRLRLRGDPLARNGFGGCLHAASHRKVSVLYERECKTYSPAEQEVQAKRIEWAGRALGVVS